MSDNSINNLKAPSLKSEYSSLKDLKEDLALNHAFFKQFFQKINKDYDALVAIKKDFPQKYIMKDDFEDLMIKSSQAKHLALTTNKLAMGLSEELEIKLEFYKAHIQIYIVDDELKGKNFTKITDSLRESYIKTHKEIAEFEIMGSRFQTLVSSLDKLFKMFESDEINFRRFLEKKDQMKGMK